MKGVVKNSQVWMSHGDTISTISNNFNILASTKDVKIAGFSLNNENTYGLQFHPEVFHSVDGIKIINNFLSDICKCSKTWTLVLYYKIVNDIKPKLVVRKYYWFIRWCRFKCCSIIVK